MNALDRIFVFPALRGQWNMLARHIEQGGEMTPAMRYIVADILRGDRELQLKQGEKRFRKTKQVADVRTLEFQGFDTTEAVNKVAAWDKVNPRTIWRALKNDQGRFDARVKSLQGLQAKTRKPNPR